MAYSSEREQAVREFVKRLTGCQARLYAYIVTLVLDRHQAEDILQQTNLVIWEKLDEYLNCGDFDAMARKVAYYQVLAYRRDALRRRQRLLFDDQLLERIAVATQKTTAGVGADYLAALRECMAKLSEMQRNLLNQRYGPDGSVEAIAASTGRPANNISAALYRIRKNLLACIREELAKHSDR